MKIISFLGSFLVTLNLMAQLNTYPGNVGFVMNPGFLGPNYQLSNIQYTGYPFAIGSFISDSSNLGLTKGVLLTTGLIWTDYGPQGPNDNAAAGLDNGYGGSSYIPDSYNAAILEFDLYSLVDTVEFRYVFGSDEYPEYVGSQFNDQFRIFIEGPGINGIQNLSYLPGEVYAGINSINYVQNSALFVNNGDGTTAPNNQSEYYIQYDGFTVPMTAKAAVQVGETYHLTVVVVDVADGIYDSGVFLEQCENCNYNASVPHFTLDQISSYPNPSDGDFTLQFPELTSSAEMVITNTLGQEVRREAILSGSKEFSINDLPSGTYIVEITSETSVWNGTVSVK